MDTQNIKTMDTQNIKTIDAWLTDMDGVLVHENTALPVPLNSWKH